MISSVGSSTTIASPQRPHRGHGPKLPDSFKSMIDTAVKSVTDQGGSRDDIAKAVQAKYEEYKKTDAYTSLSTDQKAKLDEIVKNGPSKDGVRGPRPTEPQSTDITDTDTTAATDPNTVAKQLMDVLAQRGEETRDRLSLNVGNQTAAATSIDE